LAKLPGLVGQARCNPLHVLIYPGPVDCENELVVVVLAHEAEKHHRQRDVLWMHARLSGNVLNRDLKNHWN